MNKVIAVVDVHRSYILECILGNHIVIVHLPLISLRRPISIGQNEVETISYAVFIVVFKASKVIRHSSSMHLIDLSLGWKLKLFSAPKIWQNYLRQPDGWIAIDCPYPLGYSSVELMV